MSYIIDLGDLLKDNYEYIYHYTSINKAIENIFPTSSIKFSSLKKMNDPFEFQDFIFRFDQKITNPALEASYQINTAIKRIVKVCCFSIDKDIENNGIMKKGFLRSRMWSQYADNHKGICLVFNREEFYKNLLGNADSIDIPIGTNVKVIGKKIDYSNDVSEVVEALKIKLNKSVKSYVNEYIEKYIELLLFKKLEDYRDESEYRFALYSDNYRLNDEIFVNWGESLEAIILGTNFCSEYSTNIFKASDIYSVPVFSINWINGIPEIDRTKVYPKKTEKKKSLF